MTTRPVRLLITGGAGYIGSVLVDRALRGEELSWCYHVTVLDNFMYGQSPLAHRCASPKLTIVRGDARDERILAPLIAQADVIIPLAAIVGAPACDRDVSAATSTNLDAIRLLCDLAAPSQKIIVPTTNSGYGIAGEAECTEDSPLNPISLYGQLKVHAERIVLDHGGISLRLATVFGASPRMRTDLLVNDFVFRAFHDRAIVIFEPQFRRNFLHVRDAAAAFIHALHQAKPGEVYNVGDDRANMTKLALVQKIQEHVPDLSWYEGKGIDPDKRDYLVSNDKFMATMWGPRHTLDDGIRELIKLYVMIGNRRSGNA